jgi:4-hydroxyphenylacetate 3-monooxygenase
MPRRRSAKVKAKRERTGVGLWTGREYIASLNDGRRVRVLGAGAVDDVATHPATAAVAREYAGWYDRHRDPAWRRLLMRDERTPWAFTIPRSSSDLRAMGAAIHAVSLLSGGNLTHTPGYGHLLALGAREAAAAHSAERGAIAASIHEQIAKTSRFLTYSSGGGPAADKFRTPDQAAAVRVVERTRRGVVLDGVLGVHTAVPFAHEVLILGRHPAGPASSGWFVVPVDADGVRVVARPSAARAGDRFTAPLSSRFDELDAMLALDRVLVPPERVLDLGGEGDGHRDAVIGWALWHQTIGWLARADFTLGLAVALGDVLGSRGRADFADGLTDLLIDAETTRTCLAAAELDPETTPLGHAIPRRGHLAPAALNAMAARRRMDEALRRIAGAAALIAPTRADLDDPEVAPELERCFGGGRYTARQRAALLNLTWDHLGSSLAAREASYEMFGSGGNPVWRARIRQWFETYETVLRPVLAALDVDMTPSGPDVSRAR